MAPALISIKLDSYCQSTIRRVHDQITERLAVTVHTGLNQKHKAFTLYIKIRGNVVVHWNCSVLLSCYVSSELLSSFTSAPSAPASCNALQCAAERSGGASDAPVNGRQRLFPAQFWKLSTNFRSVGQSAEPPAVAGHTGQSQFPAIRCPCPAYPRPRQSWRVGDGRAGEHGIASPGRLVETCKLTPCDSCCSSLTHSTNCY